MLLGRADILDFVAFALVRKTADSVESKAVVQHGPLD